MYIRLYIKIIRNFGSSDLSDRIGLNPIRRMSVSSQLRSRRVPYRHKCSGKSCECCDKLIGTTCARCVTSIHWRQHLEQRPDYRKRILPIKTRELVATDAFLAIGSHSETDRTQTRKAARTVGARSVASAVDRRTLILIYFEQREEITKNRIRPYVGGLFIMRLGS